MNASGPSQNNCIIASIETLPACARAATRRSRDLLVSFQQLSDDGHKDYQISNRADGIILLGYGDYLTSMPRLRSLEESGADFVIWGPIVAGMPRRYVCSDNTAGGELAARHLLGIGHRRVAYVGSASDHRPEFQQRHSGYEKALRSAGIEPDPRLRIEAQSNEAEGYDAALQLIGSGVSFDAVFAASDRIAIGVIGAPGDRGIGLPGDVSVVGFDTSAPPPI